MSKWKVIENWLLATIRKYSWAPTLIFLIHVFSITVIDVYDIWSEFDTPMHIAGGFSIAYFFTGAYIVAKSIKLIGQNINIVKYLFVFSMTGIVTIFWEFAEFASDRFLGTRMQGGVGETLLDMLLGMFGAILFISFFHNRSKSN